MRSGGRQGRLPRAALPCTAPLRTPSGPRRAPDGRLRRTTIVDVRAGVSHGLDLCVRHLLSPAPGRPQQPSAGAPQPGPVEVFVECPTYFLAQRIFAQAGCVTHHVPTTASGGLDLDALERNLLLGRRRASGAGPRLLYTIPTHHNPRGTTLDDAQRRRLVQLAHQHDLYIVADEVMMTVAASRRACAAWVIALGTRREQVFAVRSVDANPNGRCTSC